MVEWIGVGLRIEFGLLSRFFTLLEGWTTGWLEIVFAMQYVHFWYHLFDLYEYCCYGARRTVYCAGGYGGVALASQLGLAP